MTEKLTLIDCKAFVTVIFNMGLIREATISENWIRKTFQSVNSLVPESFHPKSLPLLLKLLPLVDNRRAPRNSRSYDLIAKSKPIVDHFNLKAKTHYSPCQNLSIDKSLIGTKSRTVLRQYIQTMHA